MAVTKLDEADEGAVERISAAVGLPAVGVSVLDDESLDRLRDELWRLTGLIRVFLRRPGDSEAEAVALAPGATVVEAAATIHTIWPPPARALASGGRPRSSTASGSAPRTCSRTTTSWRSCRPADESGLAEGGAVRSHALGREPKALVAGDTLVDRGQGIELVDPWLPDGVTRERVLEA